MAVYPQQKDVTYKIFDWLWVLTVILNDNFSSKKGKKDKFCKSSGHVSLQSLSFQIKYKIKYILGFYINNFIHFLNSQD